jgi:hypothetical protein
VGLGGVWLGCEGCACEEGGYGYEACCDYVQVVSFRLSDIYRTPKEGEVCGMFKPNEGGRTIRGLVYLLGAKPGMFLVMTFMS